MCAKSETLVLGYDMTDGKDLSCLQVSKIVDDKLTIINIFYGQEAENMYKKITEE